MPHRIQFYNRFTLNKVKTSQDSEGSRKHLIIPLLCFQQEKSLLLNLKINFILIDDIFPSI